MGLVSQEGSSRLREVKHFYVFGLIWRSYQNFARNQGLIYASAISYYLLFSLFPLIIITVAVFGVVVRDPSTRVQVTNAIASQIPAEFNLRGEVEKTVIAASQVNTGVVGVLAFLGLFWTASGVFGALRKALNGAFGAPGARSYLHGRLMDFLSMLSVSVLIFISTALTAGLVALREIASSHFNGTLINLAWGAAYVLLPLTMSFFVFLLTFRMVPNIALRVRDLWGGALIAAIGFEVAKVAFSLYVAEYGRYSLIYGPLGGIVAFLFFVYLSAIIVIFSACLTAERAKDRPTWSRRR